MNSLQPMPDGRCRNILSRSNTKRPPIREELIYDQVILCAIRSYELGRVWQPKRQVRGSWRTEHLVLTAAMDESNGFHEDWLSSAVDVVQGLRAKAKVVAGRRIEQARVESYPGALPNQWAQGGGRKQALAILSIMWWLDAEADLQTPPRFRCAPRAVHPVGTADHGGPHKVRVAGPLGGAMSGGSITSPAVARIGS